MRAFNVGDHAQGISPIGSSLMSNIVGWRQLLYFHYPWVFQMPTWCMLCSLGVHHVNSLDEWVEGKHFLHPGNLYHVNFKILDFFLLFLEFSKYLKKGRISGNSVLAPKFPFFFFLRIFSLILLVVVLAFLCNIKIFSTWDVYRWNLVL